MTSREQFEAWCINRLISVTRMTGCDSYQSCRTRDLWSAWQASRATIEIKLPTENELNQKVCSQCASESLEMVEEAIRSSGIKVKDC